MNGIRESFLSLDLFSLTFNKYFYSPHGPVTDWDFSQSQSYTC